MFLKIIKHIIPGGIRICFPGLVVMSKMQVFANEFASTVFFAVIN